MSSVLKRIIQHIWNDSLIHFHGFMIAISIQSSSINIFDQPNSTRENHSIFRFISWQKKNIGESKCRQRHLFHRIFPWNDFKRFKRSSFPVLGQFFKYSFVRSHICVSTEKPWRKKTIRKLTPCIKYSASYLLLPHRSDNYIHMYSQLIRNQKNMKHDK